MDKEADIFNAASRIVMGRFFLYLDLPMRDKPALQLIMCLFTKTFEFPFYKRFKPRLMNFIPKMPKNRPIMLVLPMIYISIGSYRSLSPIFIQWRS